MSDAEGPKCPFGFDGEREMTYGARHAAMPSAMPRAQLPRMVEQPIEEGEDDLRTGRCLCGAVSYAIETPAEKVFANYDDVTLRWTGGVGLTLMLRATSMRFHGWGNLVQYASSDRARNCFCRLCGSSLFVRHVAPVEMDGMISLSAGTLDDLSGLKLAAETYFDKKPDLFTLEGAHRRLSEAEIEASFGGGQTR
ncbi:MAG: GFA family protein [Pseudomonadota bacterium]